MERRCTHVLNEQSHLANFAIWGVTFWPTVERSRAYVLNVINVIKSFSKGGTLRKHIMIHSREKPHKCAKCHSVMLAILGGTFWSTINRSRKHEIVPSLFLPLWNRPTLSVQRDFVDKGQIDQCLGDILRQRGAMVLQMFMQAFRNVTSAPPK